MRWAAEEFATVDLGDKRLTFMSRGRRTHDHKIIKNLDFDRESFCRLETELFHINEERLSGAARYWSERLDIPGAG